MRVKLVLNAKAPSFSFFLIKNLIQLAKTPPGVSEENSRWQWLLSRRSLGDGETTGPPGASPGVTLFLLSSLKPCSVFTPDCSLPVVMPSLTGQ